MDNRTTIKRVRQYGLCRTIQYVGYIIIGLSILFVMSIVGTDDYYTELGQRGPEIHIIFIQFVVAVVCGFTGYTLSKYGKMWAETTKRRMIEEEESYIDYAR